MRPVEVTSEQVIEAGKALEEAGRNVTGFALRSKIGGGTPKRMKEVWDSFKRDRDGPRTPEAPTALPAEVGEAVAAINKELTDRIAQLAIGLFGTVTAEANNRIRSVEEQAKEARRQADQELSDAQSTLDELEQRVIDGVAEIERLRLELKNAGAENQRLAIENAALKERVTAAEDRARAGAEQHRGEIEQRDRAADLLRKTLDETVSRASEAKAQSDTMINTQHDHIADLRSEVENAKAQVESGRQEVARHAQEIARQTEQLKVVGQERDAAVAKEGEARERAAELRGQLDATNRQLETLTKALGPNKEPKK